MFKRLERVKKKRHDNTVEWNNFLKAKYELYHIYECQWKNMVKNNLDVINFIQKIDNNQFVVILEGEVHEIPIQAVTFKKQDSVRKYFLQKHYKNKRDCKEIVRIKFPNIFKS